MGSGAQDLSKSVQKNMVFPSLVDKRGIVNNQKLSVIQTVEYVSDVPTPKVAPLWSEWWCVSATSLPNWEAAPRATLP